MSEITYHTITHLEDALLPDWLTLYETAFPPEDRILVADFLRHLRNIKPGQPQSAEMLAAVARGGELLGLAFYDMICDIRLVALWYIAVNPDLQSQGLGSLLYQEVVRRAQVANCRAMIFEVERPELCLTPEAKTLGERRIRFYRRNGAQLLEGIHYLQSVGSHQPETPMYLMVHPFEALTPAAAFELAKVVFEESLTQVGELRLA